MLPHSPSTSVSLHQDLVPGVLVLHVPTLDCIYPLSPCNPLGWQLGYGVPLDSPK